MSTSLVSIGSLAVNVHMASYSWGSEADIMGVRSFDAAGMLLWATAQSLLELTGNPVAGRTVYGYPGVLAYLIFGGTDLGPNTGYYVLRPATLGAVTYTNRRIGLVPFALKGAYLGGLA